MGIRAKPWPPEGLTTVPHKCYSEHKTTHTDGAGRQTEACIVLSRSETTLAQKSTLAWGLPDR